MQYMYMYNIQILYFWKHSKLYPSINAIWSNSIFWKLSFRTTIQRTWKLKNWSKRFQNKVVTIESYWQYLVLENLIYLILQVWAWIPDVILFESKTISLTFELRGSLGIPRPAPSARNVSMLGAGLRIPSDTHSSKLRLIVLLSNRMTSGIHAQ